ncbi:hypothetical protein QJS10_CPB12g00647 [Acorus calamus]|uniref:Uncharacterized protein n=1 Tax=Acorus calamus TaxID=4465 RepID=A0AAV9DR66_ACOCL|nr:hypothetical protein QJS10_CPB12g00647 [Acorus calamus]
MLSQHGLVVILACIFLAIVGVCATASMCGRRTRRMNEEATREEERRLAHHREETDKKALMDSTRWSGANKLGDEAGGRVWSWITESTISGGGGGEDKLGTRAPPSMMRSVGAPTTAPPVWQRRILMGERYEMPRFSGLILYDEHGRPLGHANRGGPQQEKQPAAKITTLRDLL